ncbi:MAG TPA: GH116 family glycosyl hydrolase [Bacteroidales bacterium]|nr:GH116 family glycosyl hydrolase [Bacteroidales bacterium]
MKSKLLYCIACIILTSACSSPKPEGHEFNGTYTGEYLNRIAFPLGGIGAGMICLDGNGAFSSVSVRNKPDVNKTPFMFAALTVKNAENASRILEGPVQSWKIFGTLGTANGSSLYGCPRYESASFVSRFPFATVDLSDSRMPVHVGITGWSPFIPGDADNSGLPVGALEYTLTNTSANSIETVFSFHAENFMRIENASDFGGNYVGRDSIMQMERGFVLEQSCFPDKPQYKGEFAIMTDEKEATVDYCWFRGGWYDGRTKLWNDISAGNMPSNPVSKGATGASIYVPVNLKAKESKTVRILLSWYVPHSDIRVGSGPDDEAVKKLLAGVKCSGKSCCPPEITALFYEPWYSGKFKDITEVASFWQSNFADLRQKSSLFSETFFSSDLPAEVLEAVSANLGILKSPTVLRQKDGKLWAWEGCFDKSGCCNGSCTHVWNYAQAISHLFPSLERTLRETEFKENQSPEGHQTFRATLPIRMNNHDWYAAADGQLGGIIKMYREWRISGNTEWMKKMWPSVKQSMDFCIEHWDPMHTGTIEEPHHNTYDIEFWGPEPLCTGYYLAALSAAMKLCEATGSDPALYNELFSKGKKFMETQLYNGEYFFQQVKYKGLKAPNPVDFSSTSIGGIYSPEALAILEKEGPKYQYGTGCLSDGMLGLWIARMSGIEDTILNPEKVSNHLVAVHKYNLKKDLSLHVNPQRASYAYGKEGGLLLCSWPKGGQPTLPFVYSNEVWTGIEYQVASHLMLTGHVNEGLEIVRACRERYDGRIRNPFDEYECGHWYARAMSSYGLIQGLTGLWYDALDKTLYIDSKIGIDFKCFISTESGFGLAGLKRGKPFLDVRYGKIDVERVVVSGKTMSM